MKIKRAVSQALVLALLGAAAGLINNAFSVNGIDPFREIEDVPVYGAGADDPAGEAGIERDGICFVTLEEFGEMVEAGMPILDARTSDEYEAGHVPGAILFDYFEMGRYSEKVLPRISPYEKIGIYCGGPDCDDSEMLARELYNLGYKKLCVFRGGVLEWEEAGLELERGPEEVWE